MWRKKYMTYAVMYILDVKLRECLPKIPFLAKQTSTFPEAFKTF